MGYRSLIAEFPCGIGGLNGNQNVYQIPISELVIARNVRFTDYAIRKAPGLGLFDANPLSGNPICLEGIDWRPSPGTQRQVTVWDNGKVFKEVGGDVDNVQLATGLTFNSSPVLVEAGGVPVGDDRELYLFAKGVPPKVLTADGATMSPITNESLDWSGGKPGAAIYHDIRVYAFDVDPYPHNIYISSLLDHGDFQSEDSRVYEIMPGYGEKLVAAYSYLPYVLYAFKYPRGIFAIDTSDMTGFNLPTQIVRGDIGMAGPHGITKVGNDVIFISSNGRLYSLTALRPDVDPANADLTARLNLTSFIETYVDATRLNSARLVYDEIRKELWYIFTSKDGTVNDSALIFDLNDPSRIRVSVEDRGDYFEAMWPRISADGFSRLLCGGTGGVIYNANVENRSIGGTDAYVAEFKYPDTDLGFVNDRLRGTTKRFDFLEVTVLPTGNYEMSFEVFIDGVSHKTIEANLGNGTAVLDDAEFDLDTFGGQTYVKHRIEIDAWGNTISFKGFNASTNEDFAVVALRVYYAVGGETYEAK